MGIPKKLPGTLNEHSTTSGSCAKKNGRESLLSRASNRFKSEIDGCVLIGSLLSVVLGSVALFPCNLDDCNVAACLFAVSLFSSAS